MKNAPDTTPAGDDPNELPYPGFAREKAALDARVALATRAGATPLPGPLREAFAGDPPSLHGFTLQPVTMGLHPLLVKLNSPLLEIVRIMREALSDGIDGDKDLTPEEATAARAARLIKAHRRIAAEVKAEDETMVETVFAFVTPITDLRQILAKGRDVFREAALRAVGDKLHPVQFAELQQAVGAHYAASFATALQYEAAKSGEDGTVFTVPPAMPTTALAGGSPSSAS